MSITETRNLLLRSLPEAEVAHLLPLFTRVAVEKGERVIEAGGALDFAYFPESGLSFRKAACPRTSPRPTATAGWRSAASASRG